MNNKSLILAISLILIVFLSISFVSAENVVDDDVTGSDDMAIEPSTAEDTSKEVTVETTDTNDQIQEKINSLNDGDTLNFSPGEYKNISLYVNKSITINGNGATLYGYDTLSEDKIPSIIFDQTTEGGYAITNKATLYLLETNGLVLKDINIIAGDHSGTTKGKTATGDDDPNYPNCVIYNYKSNNTQITNTLINGCSWGIWLQNCADTIIENNRVINQGITGIFSFQSPRSIIRFNNVTNAKNHGIDVRHQLGPNAQVLNNTVIGSKEGIYLLHSKGHTVTGNTIINCTISSITCCGASNINIENNKLQNSRIGILLGGGAPQGGAYVAYSNITIGANEWKIDELPFPPSFQYYVAEAKADYASMSAMMGTHTDSSISDVTYVEYTGIETPSDIVVDYDKILNQTGTKHYINSGMNNAEIQNIINGMSDGDTLIFEANAVFENITLYITKNIKVIGNGATLKSYESASLDLVPELISNGTSEGGYGVAYSAVIYCINASNVAISDLNIVCRFPGYNPTEITKPNQREYCTAGIYSILSPNLTITNCTVDGGSWGMFIGERQQGKPNAIITNNIIKNQFTTGILCFGSANSIIANNTVTNAYNHGIDVRFTQGKNVIVFNNTISGSKEGIYLLHSSGHKVYGNTILNSKISSITCYESGNEYIFNNTLKGSRIAIILGGGYYNVTIGQNSFIPDKLPFPPSFEHYLVKSENKYYDKVENELVPGTYKGIEVQRTYSDKEVVTISAPNVSIACDKTGSLTITLIDQNNKIMSGKTIAVSFNKENMSLKTNEKGIVTIPISNLAIGTYTAEISYAGNDNYAPAKVNSTVTITKITTTLTASGKTVYLQAIQKGTTLQVTLKANGAALAGKAIIVNFNNNKYTATTKSNGVATVTLKATSTGSKSAKISFAGDDTYKPASKTVTVKVTKEATKITAKKKTFKVKAKNKKYTLTLKSKSGSKLSGVKVSLKVKGTTYTATVKKGKATFNLKKLTKKGKYTAKITFKGNKYYLSSTAKPKITVK